MNKFNACAVVGVNWGDEGKGRMVDLITEDYDVVIRYQGGGNAGHTVINEYGKFALHLLPSGVFRKNVMNILGNGVAVDIEALCKELDDVKSKGVDITPANLMVSDRASLLLPWHIKLDCLEEERLADKKYGSTKSGIAPFYSDKYAKKTILVGDLFYKDILRNKVADILEWKNLTIEKVYGAKPYTVDEVMDWLEKYGERIKPYIGDTSKYLDNAYNNDHKKVMFEAQLGALRDIDLGIVPYTTSSNTLAAFGPVGAGCPWIKIDEVVGVVKAYSTCVGEGPFTAEWFGEDADKLREAGGEYGAKTGRPRRVGPLDIVATRYGVKMQGCTNVAFTKLDVLSYMDEIPVCIKYELDGKEIDDFPFATALPFAKPVYTKLPGWKCDISGVRKFEDLPKQAQDYILFVEKEIGCHMGYISVGAKREEIIIR